MIPICSLSSKSSEDQDATTKPFASSVEGLLIHKGGVSSIMTGPTDITVSLLALLTAFTKRKTMLLPANPGCVRR